MNTKKVEFIIDKDLDFENHRVGVRKSKVWNLPKSASLYFNKLGQLDKENQRIEFENETKKFYSDSFSKFRELLIKQTNEMWALVEDQYLSKMESIHQNKFPLDKVYGILSTAPFIHGYLFKEERPWFACDFDCPARAIGTAMHEIMHLFFVKYYWQYCKEDLGLDDKQIYDVKEAVTVILNLELDDIRFFTDVGHPGHEELRQKIKESWLKNKDFKKVLEDASLFIKS